MLPILSSPTSLDAWSSPVEGYHRGLLAIGVRPAARRFSGVRAFSALESASGTPAGPGLSALHQLERAGLIRHVIPLGLPESDEVPPAMAVLGMLGRLSRGVSVGVGEQAVVELEDPNAGVSLLELEEDADVPRLLGMLAQDPDIEYAARVPVRYLSQTTIAAVPPAGLMMWNLQKIKWALARQAPNFVEAEEVRVAVLDTGIDPDHPDLRGRVQQYRYQYQHPIVPVALLAEDIIGHGTHVAGTIAALSNNPIGIDGICAARILAYKIFNDTDDLTSPERGYEYFVNPVAYRRALADCVRQRVEVVNLSIGGPKPPDPSEQKLFSDLLAQDTVVVAAMGNDRQFGSPISYPAAIPGVIAVGATRPDDRIADFSNGGNHISLCAPGVGIWSTLPTYPGNLGHRAILDATGHYTRGPMKVREKDYDSWPGTSMATPHVTGAVALLLAKKGPLSPADVKSRLMASVDQVAGMNGQAFHPDYGAGRLNLQRLLA